MKYYGAHCQRILVNLQFCRPFLCYLILFYHSRLFVFHAVTSLHLALLIMIGIPKDRELQKQVCHNMHASVKFIDPPEKSICPCYFSTGISVGLPVLGLLQASVSEAF